MELGYEHDCAYLGAGRFHKDIRMCIDRVFELGEKMLRHVSMRQRLLEELERKMSSPLSLIWQRLIFARNNNALQRPDELGVGYDEALRARLQD